MAARAMMRAKAWAVLALTSTGISNKCLKCTHTHTYLVLSPPPSPRFPALLSPSTSFQRDNDNDNGRSAGASSDLPSICGVLDFRPRSFDSKLKHLECISFYHIIKSIAMYVYYRNIVLRIGAETNKIDMIDVRYA